MVLLIVTEYKDLGTFQNLAYCHVVVEKIITIIDATNITGRMLFIPDVEDERSLMIKPFSRLFN